MGFVQKGGARVGQGFWWSVNWTWPFATLEVDVQGLTVHIPTADLLIPRANVRRVTLIGPEWAPPGFHGIVVEHDLERVPPYVLFWSFDRPNLIEALRVCGYEVSAQL